MSDIEQVSPILTVICDDGDYIVRSSKEIGKKLGQVVLSQLTGAKRVTVVSDNDVKVFKMNGKASAQPASSDPIPPDPQQEFERQVEVEDNPHSNPPRRRIAQDPAAPPAPELVEDYQKELARQQAEEAELRKQQQFQAQEAIPQQQEEEQPKPQSNRRTRERTLATVGTPCGRCGGQGRVVGDAGFEGTCPVCTGSGQVKAWGRSRSARVQ